MCEQFWRGRQDIIAPSADSHVHLVVISQDCDLVHGSYDDEPVAEILVIREVDASKRQTDLLAGKNPRRLQVRLRRDATTFIGEARPFERAAIPRQWLEGHAPNGAITLDRHSLERIPEWLAKRYDRTALPDNFNILTQDARKKFVRLLEKDHEAVRGVWVELNEYQELDSYTVGIHLVVNHRLFQVENHRRTVEALAVSLEGLFASCEGITVEFCALRPDDEFSLDDLGRCEEWDLYYLSHREVFRRK